MAGIPGVVSDGANGEIIVGGLVAGNEAATTLTFHSLGGNTILESYQPDYLDGDQTLTVSQRATLDGTSLPNALRVVRKITRGGNQPGTPLVSLETTDLAAGSVDPAEVMLQAGHLGNYAFINAVGGLGQYGVVPPTAQPTATIVTSTITDAAALAAIHALITIINGGGAALITET